MAPDGRVYVIDDQRNDIQVFDGAGRFLFAFDGTEGGELGLIDTGGVTLDETGNILVADYGNQRIVRFSPDGEPLASWGERGTDEGDFFGPIDLVVDERGHVYVVDNSLHRVQVFDREGRFLTRFGQAGTAMEQFGGVVSIARDASGQLYVSDADRGVVLAYRLQMPEAATPAPS